MNSMSRQSPALQAFSRGEALLKADKISRMTRCKTCGSGGCKVEGYIDLSVEDDIFHRFLVKCPEGHEFSVDTLELKEKPPFFARMLLAPIMTGAVALFLSGEFIWILKKWFSSIFRCLKTKNS